MNYLTVSPITNRVIPFFGFCFFCASALSAPNNLSHNDKCANAGKLFGNNSINTTAKAENPIKKINSPNNSGESIVVNYKPTGIPLQDALTLTDVRNRQFLTKENVLRILAFYAENNQNNPQQTQGSRFVDEKTFSSNKYLSEYLRNFTPYKPEKNRRYYKQQNHPTVSDLPSITIGGGQRVVDNEAYHVGIEKFEMQLSKEEIGSDFFDKFRKDLVDNKDLSTLFPSTSAILASYPKAQEVINIEKLRESFEKDLTNIKADFQKLTSNQTTYLGNNANVSAYLKSGYFTAQQLVDDKVEPGKTIINLPNGYFENLPNHNAVKCVETEKLFSEALRAAPNTDRYWASEEEFQELLSSTESMKLFLGLLEQKAAKTGIWYYTNNEGYKSLASIIDESYSGGQAALSAYKTYFRKLTYSILPLEEDHKKYINGRVKSFGENKDYGYVGDFMVVKKDLSLFENLPYFPTGLGSADLEKDVLFLTQMLTRLSIDIRHRSNKAAVKDVFKLYDTLFAAGQAKKELDIKEKSTATNNVEKDVIVKSYVETAKNIYNYGNFMVDMIEAKDSASVRSAIVATVYPNDYVVVKIPKWAKLGKNNEITATNQVQKQDPQSLATIIKANKAQLIENVAPTLQDTKQDQTVSKPSVEAQGLRVQPGDLNRKHSFHIGIVGYVGAFGGFEYISSVKQDGGYQTWGLTAPVGLSFTKEMKSGFSHSLLISALDLGTFSAQVENNTRVSESTSIGVRNLVAPGAFYSFGLAHLPLFINIGAQTGYNLRDIKITHQKDVSNSTYIRKSLSLCFRLPIWNLSKGSK